MYAHDVDVLEFRVYHVNDPEKFFAQLKSVHRFGEGPRTETREQIEEKACPMRVFFCFSACCWRITLRDVLENCRRKKSRMACHRLRFQS